MTNWWKNPVLQGPENDYGDYDYLIEELPSDSVQWELGKYASRCNSCGKERRLLLRSKSYFYTLDGYDYMDYDECWVCHLKGKLWSIKNKIKKKIKIVISALELTCKSQTGSFKYYYNIVKEFSK